MENQNTQGGFPGLPLVGIAISDTHRKEPRRTAPHLTPISSSSCIGIKTPFHDHSSIGKCSGENLLLYSDGITEAEDPKGNAYGEDGLIGSLRGQLECDAKALTDGVLGDVARFCHTAPQQDDMTLLFLWRNP